MKQSQCQKFFYLSFSSVTWDLIISLHYATVGLFFLKPKYKCHFAAALWDRVENVVAATFWITWNASSWTSKRQRRRYFITVGSPDDLLPGRIRRGALGCKPLVWSQLCHPTRPPHTHPLPYFPSIWRSRLNTRQQQGLSVSGLCRWRPPRYLVCHQSPEAPLQTRSSSQKCARLRRWRWIPKKTHLIYARAIWAVKKKKSICKEAADDETMQLGGWV